tara:strand:+ start:113 stop:727 length:615 start_codon:yes stop_codon:yes gene_type:complete
MSKLLIETQIFEGGFKKPLNEGFKPSSNGNPLVEGIMATVEVKNGNGRYYKRDIWEREMDKYQESIDQNRALGELDHPESTVINLKNASHNIKRLYWDGDHIMGEVEILPTPSGNILKTLLENGITMGVSSRGMGSLQPMGEGMMEVQDDFELLCWDFVSTPSNPGSYMAPIMEGLSKNQYDKYQKVNNVLYEILCSKGTCPII